MKKIVDVHSGGAMRFQEKQCLGHTHKTRRAQPWHLLQKPQVQIRRMRQTRAISNDLVPCIPAGCHHGNQVGTFCLRRRMEKKISHNPRANKQQLMSTKKGIQQNPLAQRGYWKLCQGSDAVREWTVRKPLLHCTPRCNSPQPRRLHPILHQKRRRLLR